MLNSCGPEKRPCGPPGSVQETYNYHPIRHNQEYLHLTSLLLPMLSLSLFTDSITVLSRKKECSNVGALVLISAYPSPLATS